MSRATWSLGRRYMSAGLERRRQPLITIVGATGTGKSELAVHLARKLGGEVINGDALQLYQGLPIVTNKITKDEQQGIPHHLLDTIALNQPTWNVSHFVREASRKVTEIRERGKIPILVGGTHYYLRSMLFNDVLVQEDTAGSAETQDEAAGSSSVEGLPFLSDEELNAKWPILCADVATLRAELVRVDPVMADRWHPNDFRKMRRSLAIYLQTGRLASEIYAEQARKRQSLAEQVSVKAGDQESSIPELGDGLRYDNLLFWTYAQINELDKRLENRVGKMIERGLLEEIKLLDRFQLQHQQDGDSIDLTRGIWAAIGYKEFADYLATLSSPAADHSASDIATALSSGQERTFIATRQYARYQTKWIKQRIYPSLVSSGINNKLYLLDSTQIASFNTEVNLRAEEIARKWLSNETLPDPTSTSETALSVLTSLQPRQETLRSLQVCDDCGMTVTTEKDWQAHLRSTKHRRAQKRKLQDARNPRRLEMWKDATDMLRKSEEGEKEASESVSAMLHGEDDSLGLAELEGLASEKVSS